MTVVPKRKATVLTETFNNMFPNYETRKSQRTERIVEDEVMSEDSEEDSNEPLETSQECRWYKIFKFKTNDPFHELFKLIYHAGNIEEFFFSNNINLRNIEIALTGFQIDKCLDLFGEVFSDVDDVIESITITQDTPLQQLSPSGFQNYEFKFFLMKMKLIDHFSLDHDVSAMEEISFGPTTLKWFPEDSKEFKLMSKYIANTFSDKHEKFRDSFRFVTHYVFGVNNQDQNDKYEKFRHCSNRKLLLHGTNKINVPSIVKNGLKLPVTGRLDGRERDYGNGIYFTDVSSEAGRHAARGRSAHDEYVVILAFEVALGEIYEPSEALREGFNVSKLPGDKNALKISGKYFPNPEKSKLVDGVEVPRGKLICHDDEIDPTKPMFNEWIIIDDQRCILKNIIVGKYIK